MQFQTAARGAARALAIAGALLLALSVAFAPAADAKGGLAGTPATTVQHHRVPATQQADWSAGPVQQWTGYTNSHGSRRVREVQRRLNRLGYQSGPVDGLFGPITERAVHRFQMRHGLRVDGVVGRHTLRALRADDHRTANPAPPATSLTSQGRPAPRRPPAPHPRPTVAPTAAHAPALPVTPILVVLGLLGLAMAWRGYVQTTAAVRRVERPRPPAAAHIAEGPRAVHDLGGRAPMTMGTRPIPGEHGSLRR
jgi:Putative peptidoglycan binding domain